MFVQPGLGDCGFPGSLQSSCFGYSFNLSLENVTLLGILQSLSFGQSFTVFQPELGDCGLA